jgi:hypothetical protein
MAKCGYTRVYGDRECTEQCRFYQFCTRNPNRKEKDNGGKKNVCKDNN